LPDYPRAFAELYLISGSCGKEPPDIGYAEPFALMEQLFIFTEEDQ
jgi:hypothetical protein